MTAPAVSRQRIHEAATRLFGRYGYDGVSLAMLADEVGLHKSTLFHHYDRKLDIALEVFEAVLERVCATLRPLASAPPRLEDLFDACDALTEWWCASPDTARLLMSFINTAAGSELRTTTSTRAAALTRELFETIGSWLERAQKSGLARPFSVRQGIVNLIGLVLFYPAVAENLADGEVTGPQRFSAKAVKTRKEELRRAIAGMLGLRV